METQELFERYVETKDQKYRDELVLRFYPLARRVAARVWRNTPSQVDLDDLISMATMGLLRAVEHYDPYRRQVPFDVYAAVTIRGGILDEIRAQDWAPRSLRRKQRDIDKAIAQFETEHHRAPSLDEIAGLCETTPQEITQTLQATEAAKFKSLDESQGSDEDDDVRSRYDSVADASSPDPELRSLRSTVYRSVTDVIKGFTAQEQLVIVLYYFERLTLAEIDRIVGTPDGKASQIHARVMLEIRQALEEAYS